MKSCQVYRCLSAGWIAIMLLSAPLQAELKVAGIFSDHMVLQRDQNLPVWGWASPSAKITVSLAGQAGETMADEAGFWKVQIDALPAGGPFELVIKSGEQTITLHDVLIGDVWLCSGQSNMDWPLERSLDGENEVAGANHESIRLFKVKRSATPEPRTDLEDEKWMPCTPEHARGITAVGYFFGRALNREIGIPIGILQSAWGGTRAEAWTEFSFLEREPELRPLVDQYNKDKKLPPEQQQVVIDRWEAWQKARNYTDPGTRMDLLGWADLEYDDSEWSQMELPGLWEAQGLDLDGAVWFRKRVEIPAVWAGKELIFHAGFIDDFDISFFNGTKIGETGAENRKSAYEARTYRIPAELVHAGEVNVLAVRVFDNYRRGGIGGEKNDLYLEIAQQEQTERIVLAGQWKYQIEHRLYPVSDGGPAEPVLPGWRHAASNLYNGMIAPLVPFALRGVIWYQGESNADRPEQYKVLFPAMIRSWRHAWDKDDLPFYWVQLANYKTLQSEPFEGGWAYIREAQTSALTLKNTGMAVITDVGDAGDIHPRDKQTVGHRLALIALANTYGRNIEFSGPLFRSAEKEAGQVRLYFDHCEKGLKTSDGSSLTGFGIRDEQGNWYWAEARVDGETVVVHHKDVKNPAGVCYNWADNPVGNLINSAGLPANSFKIDL